MSELEPKTNPLEPCPFCGGEAALVPTFDTTVREWFVTCGNLECSVLACRTKRYYTEAEAIAAWNTRHQCGLTDEDYNILLDELGVSERTCRDTDENEWHFVCSACGYEQNGYETWNYCPNCGAKVVGCDD